jgi:hypothetical protein
MHGAILKVLMLPEEGMVGRVVGVPVLILEARYGVQVEDRVDAVPSAQVDDPIKMLEARLLDLEGRHVVLEMMVVDRQPQQVQAKRLDEARVVGAEKIFQETIEEVVYPLIVDGIMSIAY